MLNKLPSQIPSITLTNTTNSKRRKSDEWVLLKRCRFDSTQNSKFSRMKLMKILDLLVVAPVQSILPNTSATNLDESAATSDVETLLKTKTFSIEINSSSF